MYSAVSTNVSTTRLQYVLLCLYQGLEILNRLYLVFVINEPYNLSWQSVIVSVSRCELGFYGAFKLASVCRVEKILNLVVFKLVLACCSFVQC